MVLAAAPAQAHMLWLEQSARGATLQYGTAGEFNGEKYEALRHRATLLFINPKARRRIVPAAEK